MSLRQRRFERGQGGFTLALVLAVVGLTFVVIVALLGFLLTTIRITENQEKDARDLRAADGAIAATINHLQQVPGGSFAECGDVGPELAEGLRIPFDAVGGADDVEVTCGKEDFGPSAGDVKLVGNGYGGLVSDWTTAWPWSSLDGGSPLGGIDPSLIHTGDAALQFNGNVSARAGAAVLRDPVSGTPAANVRGSYTQGTAGLGASGTSCGLLAEPESPTQVQASGGMTCGATITPPAQQNYGIDTTERSVSGSCPAGPVVTLPAGRYDQDDVRTLNRWFGGDCPDRTFHFPTGIYWFDANDPSRPADARHTLVIDDPTSSFVFGQANGWSPSGGAEPADFPNACSPGVDAASPGASIVLSGRTEFRHLGGRLAICPFVSPEGTAYPTVLQQATAPRGVQVVSASSSDWASPSNLLSGSSATPASATFTCSFPSGGTTTVFCESQRSFTLGLRSQAAGPLSSASLRLTGQETQQPVNLVQSRTARLRITLPGGATCDPAATPGAPDRGRTSVYELVSGSCASVLTDGSKLDGASVQVTYAYRYAGVCVFGPCPISSSNAQRLELWAAGVEVNAWRGDGSSIAEGGTTTWSSTVQNTRLDDTSTSASTTLCGQPVCGFRTETTYERSFRLAGVQSRTGSTIESDDQLDSVGVAIDQVGAQAQGFNLATLPGRTRLTLTLNDGTACTREFDGIANTQGRTYYSMIDSGATSCGGTVLRPDQMTGANLLGSSIEVRYVLSCVTINGVCNTYFQPVAVQHAGLIATSESYNGPVTQAQITVDADPTGEGSSANFFGPAYLPRSSLDIRWNGTASGASIFGGELQLHSLASVMASGAAADVVCCTRPGVDSRKVELTAWIGGAPRLVVSADIPRATAEAPRILQWRECRPRGGCG
jgi:hypothetical protein